MDETRFSAPCFLVPIASWLMVLLLVECCPLQGVYLYRIKQIFSTRAVQKCSKGFPCTRRHNKRFDHCLWIWVCGNTLFKIGYDWMLFLSILGFPHVIQVIPSWSPADHQTTWHFAAANVAAAVHWTASFCRCQRLPIPMPKGIEIEARQMAPTLKLESCFPVSWCLVMFEV